MYSNDLEKFEICILNIRIDHLDSRTKLCNKCLVEHSNIRIKEQMIETSVLKRNRDPQSGSKSRVQGRDWAVSGLKKHATQDRAGSGKK